MPHRLMNMVAPVAHLEARKMAPALEALVAHASMDAAMTGALIARGVEPGIAHMTVDQWRSLGLFIPSSVYAPAHITESALMGTTAPIARQVATAQPWIPAYLSITPGYERAMAQPGIAGKAPGIAGLQPGIAGKAPGIAGLQPGIAAKGPALGLAGQFPQPGFGAWGVSPWASPWGATPWGGTDGAWYDVSMAD